MAPTWQYGGAFLHVKSRSSRDFLFVGSCRRSSVTVGRRPVRYAPVRYLDEGSAREDRQHRLTVYRRG